MEEAHATGILSPSNLIGIVLGDTNFTPFLQAIASAWRFVRVMVIAPMLRVAIFLCLFMTVMILLEKLYVGFVSLIVKIFKLKPRNRYKCDPITPDAELGNLNFPLVLVQIPMYNEREVYKLSISAACDLDWPAERKIVQVLDDSTDPAVKELVQLECQRWKSKGVNIKYEVRSNRKGYKAGALKKGMKYEYAKKCDYVAMFDADFQPEPDFLMRTIPYLVHNPEIALVQARWKFVNADECLMTRIQEMSLDYHFKIEQEAGSSTFAFFGFNGTAGVWRINAIKEAGGWKDRTTVEDMDLAVRASLNGWKFIYVGDVKVKNELPSTFKAYRYQQHRWSCGPANLFKKMAMEILTNKKVPLSKRLYLIYSFFFVGKIVAHIITFIFYCLVIPISVLVPEVQIPTWGLVYVPLLITLCKAFGTPRSFHLVILWVLFENVMSLHRIKAAVIGLLDIGRVNEWIVTEKLGDANKQKLLIKESTKFDEPLDVALDVDKVEVLADAPKQKKLRFWQRFYYLELVMGVFLLLCGCYDVAYTREGYFVYLFLQSIAFFVVGFDYVGTYVPST